MSEDEAEAEAELEWKQTGTTTAGDPIYECAERPGWMRVGVPSQKWRAMFVRLIGS